MKEKLVKLRNDAGLTRFQLAVKINNAISAIYNWEKGVSTPSAEAIYKMAKAFGVTTDEIFAALDIKNTIKKD